MIHLLLLLFLAAPIEAQENLFPEPKYFESYDFALIPSHKLMFCRIHKVGTTPLNLLLAALAPTPYPDHPDWTVHEAADYNLTAVNITSIIKDPSWVKAVFYREPLERFLSAYRSKCETVEDTTCDEVFLKQRPSFKDAVRSIVLQEDLRTTVDSHFLPQARTCYLRDTFPYFTETFMINPATMRENLLRIFKAANVRLTAEMNEILDRFYTPTGVHDMGTHNTYSSKHSTLRKYYNHDCYIRLIVHHYQEDYTLFKIPYPEWAKGAMERVTVEKCLEMMKRQ